MYLRVSCHSPALHAILFVIPLQRDQTQSPWARNSLSQIPHSWPARSPLRSASQTSLCPKSHGTSFELVLLCPAPAHGQPGVTWPAVERRNEVAAHSHVAVRGK